MNVRQLEHEIEWLECEITKLEVDLPFKPSKQKQIDTYKHQIKHKELDIMLDFADKQSQTVNDKECKHGASRYNKCDLCELEAFDDMRDKQ